MLAARIRRRPPCPLDQLVVVGPGHGIPARMRRSPVSMRTRHTTSQSYSCSGQTVRICACAAPVATAGAVTAISQAWHAQQQADQTHAAKLLSRAEEMCKEREIPVEKVSYHTLPAGGGASGANIDMCVTQPRSTHKLYQHRCLPHFTTNKQPKCTPFCRCGRVTGAALPPDRGPCFGDVQPWCDASLTMLDANHRNKPCVAFLQVS